MAPWAIVALALAWMAAVSCASNGGGEVECVSNQDCVASRGDGWVCDLNRCVYWGGHDAGVQRDTGRAATDLGALDSGSSGESDTGPGPICDPPCRGDDVCLRGRCVNRCAAPLGCPEDVMIDLGGFSIDAYEASRPDADPGREGCNQTRACSAAGRLPWTGLTWQDAARACEAAGKRLCTSQEWRAACSGLEGYRYPYGDGYRPDACNGAGTGTMTVWATGSSEQCRTPQGVYDLSGNVHEWVADDLGPGRRGTLGGSVMNNMTQLACDYDMNVEGESYENPLVGFRCCK